MQPTEPTTESTTERTNQPTTEPRQNLGPIALPKKARGMLFGTTGSGKSTLAEALMRQWLASQKAPRVLILDSKPRFRAQWELTGVSTRASRRYKKWEHGSPVPNSYVLPLHDPASELKQVWRLGGTVAIAQVESLRLLPALQVALATFYRQSNAKYSQLVMVDEMADFFGSSATFGRGDAILQVARSGRERGIAMLGCSQRPRHIPTAVLTEASQVYIFELAYDKDLDHLKEMGLPRDVRLPTGDHQFLFYSRQTKQGGYYKLATKAGQGG
jgi:energy-coupling factor transporter ATP-binding protein EcfA2